ncbi:MAG TPA: penicillin-insensitive murein endopeptidase [Usitatibacteraceae bacterium]
MRFQFRGAAIILMTAMSVLALNGAAAESVCYGTVGKGALENGVKLPLEGKNFSAYSSAGSLAGRTHVHSAVEKIVVAAYARLAVTVPDKVFVYGETGWAAGGRMRPHRTHQNGTSIDFMVPVLDKAGHSVALPTSAFNQYGYGIDFDGKGNFGALRIDFEAMAEHLYELAAAAKRQNVGIALVIFDPPLMPMLLNTRRGPWLKENLPFMKGQAWIRHDEHYHVDFAIPCKPLKQ